MQANVSAFSENTRALIATVNIIDEANTSNEQINHKLLKMYEQIYADVKSISTVELPEHLKPEFSSCEEQLTISAEMCEAELAKHKLEIVQTAEKCRTEFDVGVSHRIIKDIRSEIQEGQSVEDTFAEQVFKSHSVTKLKSVQTIEAIQNDLQTKRTLLAENDHVEQLDQNFDARSVAASAHNIQGIDLMNGIRSSAEHFTENSAEYIRQCGKDLRNFRERGFREYEPSGGTPMKREYGTNVRLVSTEPHDLIKADIRKKIDEGLALECSLVGK